MNPIALKPAEAAKLLGISSPTLRNLTHRKKDPLPSFSIGTATTQMRIPYAALLAWANRQAGYEIDLKEAFDD